MYSAEPLPHFVDEYLAYLYEVHPTNAAFDGVHLHDDLVEDVGRQALEAQIRTLGGFARRLAAIDPARLTETERLERELRSRSDGAEPGRRAARCRREGHDREHFIRYHTGGRRRLRVLPARDAT